MGTSEIGDSKFSEGRTGYLTKETQVTKRKICAFATTAHFLQGTEFGKQGISAYYTGNLGDLFHISTAIRPVQNK